MKKVFKIPALIFVIFIAITSCDQLLDEDPVPENVYEQISGTWVIDEVNMFGTDIQGDGSSLTFTKCDEPPCTGQDYKASGETTGTFTYQFIENDSKILIVDEDEKGGNYNASWSILEFENGNLRMTGEFGVFGNMQLMMSK